MGVAAGWEDREERAVGLAAELVEPHALVHVPKSSSVSSASAITSAASCTLRHHRERTQGADLWVSALAEKVRWTKGL